MTVAPDASPAEDLGERGTVDVIEETEVLVTAGSVNKYTSSNTQGE